jgi:hypothetical protein
MGKEQEQRYVLLTRDELIWLQHAASYYSGNVLGCYMEGQRPKGFDGRSGNKLSFEDLELAPPLTEGELRLVFESVLGNWEDIERYDYDGQPLPGIRKMEPIIGKIRSYLSEEKKESNDK